MVEPGEILNEAAAYLEENGWHQGSMFDWKANSANPPACVAGAIEKVASSRIAMDARAHLWKYLTRPGEGVNGMYLFSVPRWNDSEARTKEEVVATLRAAAEWEAP